MLPNWLIEEDLQTGALINVFPDYTVTATNFSTAVWLVYSSRTYIPLKVQVFIEFLKKTIPQKSVQEYTFRDIEQ